MARKYLDRELFTVEVRHVLMMALGLLFLWGAYHRIVGYPHVVNQQLCERWDELRVHLTFDKDDGDADEAPNMVKEMNSLCTDRLPLRD